MAFVRNPIVYVPDLTNGRPVVDGKVYLLAKGTIAPTHSSSINPSTLLVISYINEAGNTVPQPQPLYTSKGGCLYGSYPDEARQFSLAEQEYVFAVYNRIGRLEYAGHYTNSALSADYVGETAPLTPFQGMRWYNPSIPTTFIYYVDANSEQWVEEVRQGGDSPFVTPEMFGAKGDLITDDAPAIQAAINHAALNKGLEVRLLRQYASSGVEILNDNIIIRGLGGRVDGIGATHIKYIATSGVVGAFCFGQPKSGTGTLTPVKGCKLIGMTIDGNRAGGAVGSAVRSSVFDGFTLEDVHTYDCAQNYGFAIIGTGLNPRKRLKSINCSALRCGADGMDIKAGGEHIYIENFESGDHLDETSGDSVGLDLRGQYITVVNPVTYNCPEIGLRVRTNVGISLNGSWGEGDTGKAIVNISNPISYGNRDNYDLTSPNGSVVNVTNINSLNAIRFGVFATGNGSVNITNGVIRNNLTGVSLSPDTDVNLVNVEVVENTQDGIAGNDAKEFKMVNGSISRNGRYGISQGATPSDARWLLSNVDISGNLTNFVGLSSSANGNITFENVNNTAATTRGVQITECPALIEFNGGRISGNATNLHSINANARFRNVSGITSKAKGSQSFAVDAVTTLTVTVTHGLSFTPTVADIQLSLSRNTNVNDYDIGFIRIVGTSSTIFSAQIRVTAASATAGALANLVWSVITRD